LASSEARVTFLDSDTIFTRDLLKRLMKWASDGRVLVLPRSRHLTEMAKDTFDELFYGQRPIDIDMGLRSKVLSEGAGKIVVYDLPETELGASSEFTVRWKQFVEGTLSLADVHVPCQIGDPRISTVALQNDLGMDSELALFVLNSSSRVVTADLHFSKQVTVRDFAATMKARIEGARGIEAPPAADPANRFTLEIPPSGILPLSISTGESLEEKRPRVPTPPPKTFEVKSESETMLSVSASELPGLEDMDEASSGFFDGSTTTGGADPWS